MFRFHFIRQNEHNVLLSKHAIFILVAFVKPVSINGIYGRVRRRGKNNKKIKPAAEVTLFHVRYCYHTACMLPISITIMRTIKTKTNGCRKILKRHAVYNSHARTSNELNSVWRISLEVWSVPGERLLAFFIFFFLLLSFFYIHLKKLLSFILHFQ